MAKHIILGASLLLACAGSVTPVPEPESPAGALYVARCGSCHSVPHPKRNTADQWVHLLDMMDREMEHRGVAALPDSERAAILAYLEAHAR